MISFLKCHSCGKTVSTAFTPIPTDTPDRGLIVRAWISCPECLEKDEIRHKKELLTHKYNDDCAGCHDTHCNHESWCVEVRVDTRSKK